MNLKALILFAGIVFTNLAFSQQFEYESMDWEENPTWMEIDSNLYDEQEVVLINERLIELFYSEEYNNRLLQYYTFRHKVRVFGDDAIQANNKVYISLSGTIDIINAKARVITPDNKIIELDESNILESEGGDGFGPHKYFAIDGVVKGSDIEYMYTALRFPEMDGIKYSFQNDAVVKEAKFSLVTPPNLGFAFKSYNGFPDIILDTAESEKNIYHASSIDIPALKDEPYSAYSKNKQAVVYKFDRNYSTGKSNVITFGTASQNIYETYYNNIDKPSLKKLKKFIDASGALAQNSSQEKVRKFEEYLKTTIAVVQGINTKTIREIIDDGATSKIGITYMFIQAMKIMDIKHELMLTCDRFSDIFDKDFEHYQVLKNMAIYFPKMKLYCVPEDFTYRLGMLPSDWTAQNGLFIKELNVGDITTGIGKVKYIKPLSSAKTHDDMVVNVDFSTVSEPVINFERSLTGYSSVYFQSAYDLIDEKQQKELDESLIMFADNKGEIIDYEVSGTKPEDFVINPMVYKGSMKATSILENAGNKYLFKVGQLIGPQTEMYSEEERTTPIVHDHNMVYNRTITFTVPEGYEISGLDDLNIKEEFPEENPKIKFVSNYEQVGDKVTITVIEQYDEIEFPKENINDFRRIINGAANFNKVVLLLVKK